MQACMFMTLHINSALSEEYETEKALLERTMFATLSDKSFTATQVCVCGRVKEIARARVGEWRNTKDRERERERARKREREREREGDGEGLRET
jgi:hypothetical protein